MGRGGIASREPMPPRPLPNLATPPASVLRASYSAFGGFDLAVKLAMMSRAWVAGVAVVASALPAFLIASPHSPAQTTAPLRFSNPNFINPNFTRTRPHRILPRKVQESARVVIQPFGRRIAAPAWRGRFIARRLTIQSKIICPQEHVLSPSLRTPILKMVHFPAGNGA